MQSLTIDTNVLSLVLQNNLASTTSALNNSMEKLSTGKKINSAADGAAQLAISEKLSAQISGTAIAKENVQQGILAMEQTDSSLQAINDNLAKIRDLALQAANGTYSAAELDMMEIEAQGYVNQINSIATSASFNDIKLLDGTANSLQLQVGANAGDTLDIGDALTRATASALGITSTAITNAFTSASGANSFIATVDSAIASTSTKLAKVGAHTNSLNSTLENLAVRQTNLESSNSLIMDVDYASEVSKYVQLQIQQQATISLLSQANTMPTVALNLI